MSNQTTAQFVLETNEKHGWEAAADMAERFDHKFSCVAKGDLSLGGVRTEYFNTYEYQDGSAIKITLYAKKIEVIA